jgi:MYND finger/NlpC/P60 family
MSLVSLDKSPGYSNINQSKNGIHPPNQITEVVTKIFCNDCKKENSEASLCNRCKKVRYCNATCQKNDWKTHQPNCFAFINDKIVGQNKQIGNKNFPVFSLKENQPHEVNLSAIKALIEMLISDFCVSVRKYVTDAPKPNPHDKILLPLEFIMGYFQEFFASTEPILKTSLDLINNYFEEYQFFLSLNDKDLDHDFAELKNSISNYINENRRYGNHTKQIFEVNEEDVKPFGGKELIDKIDVRKFSCNKFALLKLKAVRYKEYIFTTSGVIDFNHLIESLNYKPVREPKKGDLVVYFLDGKPTHFGIYLGEGRVLSKWGDKCLYIFNHEIFDVCKSYGYEAVFFRPS